MRTEPCAASTAGEVKFSDAISWIVVFWRSSSRRMMSAISGSVAPGRRMGSLTLGISPFFDRGDLVDAALVAAALEVGGEPHLQDLVGQSLPHHTSADRQHVGVVVPAARLGGVQVVAQRGAHALHLVRGDLLALTAPTEHDAPVGPPGGDLTADGGADRRVVDRRLGVGAEVVHLVAVLLEHDDEMLLQAVARVVGADGDPHGRSRVGDPVSVRARRPGA